MRAPRAGSACLWAVVALMVLGGLRYLTLTELLPHHAAALGKTWSELGDGERVLFLAAMRSAGGAFIGCGVALAILLAGPYRRGEPWARHAVLAVTLIASTPLAISVLTVHARTAARPPTPLLAAGLALLLAGFFLARPVPRS